MTDFTKRIFKALAGAAVSALCQFFGKSGVKPPDPGSIGVRKTSTTIKTTQKRKGERP